MKTAVAKKQRFAGSAKPDAQDSPPKRGRFERWKDFPWRRSLWAFAAMGSLVYYLVWAAPQLVPVPPEVKTTYPPLTQVLDKVVVWCGQHPAAVVAAALVLLARGLVSRTAARYYLCLTVAAVLTLAVTYYSISAPVDRLLNAVEKSLPQDNRVPGAKKVPGT